MIKTTGIEEKGNSGLDLSGLNFRFTAQFKPLKFILLIVEPREDNFIFGRIFSLIENQGGGVRDVCRFQIH